MIYHNVKAISPVIKAYIIVSTGSCRAQLLMLLYCWLNGNKKLSNSAFTIREFECIKIYQLQKQFTVYLPSKINCTSVKRGIQLVKLTQ